MAETPSPAATSLSRRRFLQASGTGLVAAAVLAACGDSGSSSSAATSTTLAADSAGDVRILRTATSIELLHVEIYTKIVDSKLVQSPQGLEIVKLLQANHKEQAELFRSETLKLKGEAFTQPNGTLARMLESKLSALRDETGILGLALETERTAAATYQSYVGQFSADHAVLNQVVMSVGGAAARAAAVLAGVLGQPPVAGAMASTAGAVAAGTGV